MQKFMLPSMPETPSSLGKMDFLWQKKRPTVAPVVLLSVNIYWLSVEGEKVHHEEQSPVDLLFVYRRESPVRLRCNSHSKVGEGKGQVLLNCPLSLWPPGACGQSYWPGLQPTRHSQLIISSLRPSTLRLIIIFPLLHRIRAPTNPSK